MLYNLSLYDSFFLFILDIFPNLIDYYFIY